MIRQAVGRKRPPGPRGRPVVGCLPDYLRDPLGFLQAAVRAYGDVVRIPMGPYTEYLVNRPDLIEEVLRGHDERFVKDVVTRGLFPLVGNGLLTSEGAFWRRQRKLAQPAFQHAQVAGYAAVMVEETERMLAGWRWPSDGGGLPIDLHAAMMRLTLVIVARCLFQADVAGAAETIGAALEQVMDEFLKPYRWIPLADRLPLPSNLRFRRAVRAIDRVVFGILERRRAVPAADAPGDLLAGLLAARDDEGRAMTDRQIRDEVVTLILAGHETTALALSYAFVLLARHPEAEFRLAAELAEVLGDRPPTVDDLPRLRFSEWVVRETLRLYPPAWGIGREAVADTELGGFFVPKGTQISLCQWVTHRDPRWFDDPEAFRPERWDDDLIKRLPRGAYFPFGDGPRICIGGHFAMMEATLILATIARRFRLEQAPGPPIEPAPSITLRPKGAIRMIARRRPGKPPR